MTVAILKKKYNVFIAVLLFFVIFSAQTVQAANIQDLIDQNIIDQQMIQDWLIGEQLQDPLISIGFAGESVQASSAVQMIFLFALIALAPTLLIMITSFTRIIIVMHFLRSALGTQQMPPNQILIGLALFLTFFLMGPIFMRVHQEAFEPYAAGTLTQAEALEVGIQPFRDFMIHNVHLDNLALFAGLAGEQYTSYEQVPLRVLIPAFILGELTIGFIFGFFLFIPFIVIDMVVASVLMAMGMMMLPPAMISTPFKILLFIMVDGWSFIIERLIMTFNI